MVAILNGKVVPSGCQLIGLCWLVDHFNLNLPIRNFCCISEKRLSSKREKRGEWTVFDAQLQYEKSVGGHLEFSLKHETLDLLLLKIIFDRCNSDELLKFISANPKGLYRRKIWFYFEFFRGKKLVLEDLPAGKYENLLDEKEYFTSASVIKSKRHKINNNLLGTSRFCPIVCRTEKLKEFIEKNLSEKAKVSVGEIGPAIARRAASFLLLADSKASFEIEGERPPAGRLERWGRIINEAGKNKLSLNEVERLHAALIHNTKQLKIGIREEGVFLGERDREGNPIPEFIGAKPDDLKELMDSWIELNDTLERGSIDPVIHASIIAFAFIYIHPLEDGNGRIHRYLFHHILAEKKFYPEGMIFPISSVILDAIDRYREVLLAHSGPLMECIEWDVTQKKNVLVTNETIDLYRYFDSTLVSEFVYECAQKTIEEVLPREIKYLECFDKSFREAKEVIEMADHQLKQLLTFIAHNDGKLSERKRKRFFENLSKEIQAEVEEIICENFNFNS